MTWFCCASLRRGPADPNNDPVGAVAVPPVGVGLDGGVGADDSDSEREEAVYYLPGGAHGGGGGDHAAAHHRHAYVQLWCMTSNEGNVSASAGNSTSSAAAPASGELTTPPTTPKMVKTFQAYLPSKCHRTYSCVHCRAHLANHDELISKVRF